MPTTERAVGASVHAEAPPHRPNRQIRENPYLRALKQGGYVIDEKTRELMMLPDEQASQELFIQYLETQCDEKADRYEANIQEHALGNNAIVMIEPMQASYDEERLPPEYVEILDYIDGINGETDPMIRFLTNGTILAIPRSHQQLMDLVTRLNEKCYIGIGTARGLTQPLTRALLEDSTGILISHGINGDKRKFSDIGAFSQDAVTTSRRALELDKRRREAGLTFDAAIYSMEDPSLRDVNREFMVKSDTKKLAPDEQAPDRSSQLRFYRIGLDEPLVGELYRHHNDSKYEEVRSYIHYDPRRSKKRSLQDYMVIGMDMIDSSEATARLDRKSFKRLYKTMMAYYRTMLYVYESVWDKFYRPRLELQQRLEGQNNPMNPVVIMYGESAEFYLPHLMPEYQKGLLDSRKLSYRLESIARHFDKKLYDKHRKMLQSGFVFVDQDDRMTWEFGGYGQVTTGENSIPKLHKATSSMRLRRAKPIWSRGDDRRLKIDLDAYEQEAPPFHYYDVDLLRLLKF